MNIDIFEKSYLFNVYLLQIKWLNSTSKFNTFIFLFGCFTWFDNSLSIYLRNSYKSRIIDLILSAFYWKVKTTKC